MVTLSFLRHLIYKGMNLFIFSYTSSEIYDTLNYELFAVAVHLGRSIFSGHYVAYAKRNGKVIVILICSGITLMIHLFLEHLHKKLFPIMLTYCFLGESSKFK